MNDIVILHDGIGRFEVHRRIVHTAVKACDFCGNNRYGRLFQYGYSNDDKPYCIAWDKKYFCNKDCYNVYHF